MQRGQVLQLASAAVAERDTKYGSPAENFNRIACRWRSHLLNRFGIVVELDAISVAMMLADMKLARLEADPTHSDSWVDLGGYAACGGEVARAGEGEDTQRIFQMLREFFTEK